ncbi:HNH endonuclease [Nonomuraea sp. FMUSA5-5]|uniref:HNH endonuclease n=1 Tax=Nonomuraea composti TaxID=2720023 RepID=A0ABX1BJE6_9ACTN|nr:HNH endonuclease [Nonomuraea sp. FMUSA5-5]
MKAYVGVTDGDWYRFMSARPTLTEANFWRPSGSTNFRALRPGEPFFFKTHHPDRNPVNGFPYNRVVGGGIFETFQPLPLSEAWETFGEANGADHQEQMRERISKYRQSPIAAGEDPIIGCVMLRDTRFFELPAGPPPDFASNIVQGKGYDMAAPPYTDYFTDLMTRLLGNDTTDVSQPWRLEGPVFGDPRLAPRRLGQRAFKAVVLNAYAGRCAITGSTIRPVLQAAHIRPVTRGGEHRLDNGILLRSDMHILFDHGYLAIDTDYRLRVSPRLSKEFGDGDELHQHAGSTVTMPANASDRPSRAFLEWHLNEVFLAT